MFGLKFGDQMMTLDELYTLAHHLFNATIVPKWIRTEDDIVAIAFKASALGIDIYSAFQAFYLPREGSMIGMTANGIKAAIFRSGLVGEWHEEFIDDKSGALFGFRIWGRRKDIDGEFEEVFTLDDARKAGLVGRGGMGMYDKYLKYMLRARGTSGLGRDWFADVLIGVYSDDEVKQIEREKGSASAPDGRTAAASEPGITTPHKSPAQPPTPPHVDGFATVGEVAPPVVADAAPTVGKAIIDKAMKHCLAVCSLKDDEAQLDEHETFAAEVEGLAGRVNAAEQTLLETMVDATVDDARAWLFEERCRKFHDEHPDDHDELLKRWQQLMNKGVFDSESAEAARLDEWLHAYAPAHDADEAAA